NGACRVNEGTMPVYSSYLTTGGGCFPRFGLLQSLFSFTTYPAGAPNVERVRIYSSVSSPATLVTGHQYGLMRIQIPSGTLTGCDGCLEGVEIRLVSVQLGTTGCVSAPHAADVLIQTPDYAGSDHWQSR